MRSMKNCKPIWLNIVDFQGPDSKIGRKAKALMVLESASAYIISRKPASSTKQ